MKELCLIFSLLIGINLVSALQISFTDPTPKNNSFQNEYITVNVSSNATLEHYTMLDLDKSLLLWMRMEETQDYDDTEDFGEGTCTNSENAYDENWKTYSRNTLNPCTITVRYTYPDSFDINNVSNEFKVTINDANELKAYCIGTIGFPFNLSVNFATVTASGVYNFSIPSTCLDNENNALVISYTLNGTGLAGAGVKQIDLYEDRIWWNRINKTTNPKDSSSYLNNGTVNGDMKIHIAQGYFGGGAYSDGTGDYITLKNSIPYYPNITIAAWVKRDATGVWFMITGGTANGYTGISSNNRMIMSYANASEKQKTCYSLDTVPAGSWKHLAYVAEEYGNISLYIDGVSQALTGCFHPRLNGGFSSTYQLILNSYGIGKFSTLYATGNVDEVMVFNRSLSEAEIKSLYSATANQYQNDFNLLHGNHTITAYTGDTWGRINQTETRYFEVNCWNYLNNLLFIPNSCGLIDFGNVLKKIYKY